VGGSQGGGGSPTVLTSLAPSTESPRVLWRGLTTRLPMKRTPLPAPAAAG